MRHVIVGRKAGTFAVSAVLAVSLAAGVTPAALAQTGDTTVTRSADAAKADAYDADAIAAAVTAYKNAGGTEAAAKVLQSYLEGKAVASADLATVDTDIVKKSDEKLAVEVKALQAVQDASNQSNASNNSASNNASADSNTSSNAQNAAVNESQQAQNASSEANGSQAADANAAAEQAAPAEDQAAADAQSVTDQQTDATTDGTLSSETPSQKAETYVPGSIKSNMSTSQFINSIAADACTVGQENDLYASVMIAQAVLESGSGSSSLSRAPYYNLFGIKGSYQGNSVTMSTVEDDGNGNHYSIDAAFRAYPSPKESLEDYADLLTNVMATYYAPVRKSNTTSFVDACNYLQGHYATDTSYSAKLQDIISVYHLTDYDDPATAAEALAASEEEVAQEEAEANSGDDAMLQAIMDDGALVASYNGSEAGAEDGEDGESGSASDDANPLSAIVPGAAALALGALAARQSGPFRRDPAMDAAKTLIMPAHATSEKPILPAEYETVPEGGHAAAAE